MTERAEVGGEQAHGLGGVGIEGKEGLGHFHGAVRGGAATATQLAFGGTRYAVRVDGQALRAEVAGGAAELSQSDLQLLGIGDGVGVEQVMDGGVGSHKR